MLNKKIKKLINASEVVSFDIFDTLIERMVVKPSYVFDIVEKSYNSQNINKITNFKKIRIQSEKEARFNSKNEEIEISEIYDIVKHKLKNINIENLMNIELEIEEKICKRKNCNYDILNYCYNNNKKVVICSDMYLPKNLIEKILKNNDIKYDKLYLSSDLNKTKSSGSIYKYIIKDINIRPNKVLHIGDNIKSDFFNPKKYNIKSILLKKKEIKLYDNIMVDYSFLSAENDIQKEKNLDYFYNFGYKYLGIVMLCFCRFINENVKNNDNLIFLAREGQFIKKCFDEIYPENNSKYMYISRKSVSSSLLYYYDDILSMKQAQSLSPKETVETFLKRWDILNEKTLKILELNEISISNNLNDMVNNDKLQEIFETLKIEANAKKKNEIFKRYLEQLEINENSVLVDIGWSGTMQDLIQQQLSKNKINIRGIYLGLRNKKKNDYKQGFLFNGENNDIEILSRSMTGFLEILFSANHGTTIGYDILKNEVNPILADNDIEKFELEKIYRIQEGCLDFIKKYKSDDIINLFDCYKISYMPLYDFCINPKKEDINEFKKFSVIDEKKYNLIGNRLGFKYLFHPKCFVNDYILSCWKNAYLKSIFKIKLPYNSIFKFAYKRRS